MQSGADIDAEVIAPAAIRSGYLDAVSYALFVPFSLILEHSLAALIGALLVWFALSVLFDRYRLGPDYKERQKAERSFMRNGGFGPFFFAFAWSMTVYLFVEVGVSGVSIPFGTAFFAAIAIGKLSETAWMSFKIRSVS